MSNKETKDEQYDEAAALKQDRSDLHRGVIVNTIGNLIKLAHPLLMGIAIWLYGEVIWGIFVTAQAALLPLGRLCMLGLDKGLLWWTPKQSQTEERDAILPTLIFVTSLTLVIAILVSVFFAPWLAEWQELPEAESNIRWMSFGLVPMAIMDILISATLGKRNMTAQVVVRDTLWPISMVAFAILFYFIGFEVNGFAMAFVLSGVMGAGGAAWFFLQIFKDSQWPEKQRTIPKPLLKYIVPMWGAEVTNSWLSRMDQIVIFALTDAATAGVYGVVMMVGNAIRTIRRAFDPIVTAIFSGVEAKGSAERLRWNFSHATSLVIGTQMPVFAFILVFTPWIVPLIGDSFTEAIDPINVICGFWLINGALGLNGLIINGFGRSDLTLINVWITLLVEAALLYALIPPYGLIGAATAVGLSYTVQNIIQAVQARWITGSWNYRMDVVVTLGVSVAAFVAMGLFWFLLSGSLGETWGRLGSFLAFLMVGTPLAWVAHKAGWFSSPVISEQSGD